MTKLLQVLTVLFVVAWVCVSAWNLYLIYDIARWQAQLISPDPHFRP